MARARRQARTLLELCVARAGGNFGAIRKGMRVCEFIVQWALLSALEDRAITLAEYREFWDEPVRTAARHLAEFRECFGEGLDGFGDPQPLADHLRGLPGFEERMERVRVLRRQGGLRASDLDAGFVFRAEVAL